MLWSFFAENIAKKIIICEYSLWQPVFRIRGLLVLIRLRNLLFWRCKNNIFPSSFASLLKLILHHSSRINGQKEVKKSRNQVFSYYFCLMMGEFWSGSGSVHLTNGTWRPKILLIQIRNTGVNIFCCVSLNHGVYRVPCFLSIRLNWVLLFTRKVVLLLPPLGPRGDTHSPAG